MSFFDQLMTAIKYMALIGILAHVIGEALPRRWFHWERFPYRAFAWEREGRFYESLGIRKWKDHLPDKSKHTKKTFTKQMKGHDNTDSLVRFLCGGMCPLVPGCVQLSPVRLCAHALRRRS